MIPASNKFGYLPPGKPYETTWEEFTARFGTTDRRRKLLAGLCTALLALKAAGCRVVYVNGSFVTSNADPADWDACWEMEGVDFDVLDALIVDQEFTHVERKRKYLGDLFLQAPRLPGGNFLAFFQKDRDGTAKGIVEITLDSMQ